MESAIAELPLAIFTTLVPFGAGAFIIVAISLFITKYDDVQMRMLDRLSAIPWIVVVIGFIASFFHLAAPLNALNIFAGLGTSPLSNEIFVGVIFAVVAFVYCLIAFIGKFSDTARKVFAIIVAALAVVFVIFTGLAYMMETIASWDTPLVPIEMIGLGLLGGAALGAMLIAIARRGSSDNRAWTITAFVMALVGFLVALVALIGHYNMLEALSNSSMEGESLASSIIGFLIAFAICGALAVCALGICCRKSSVIMSTIAAVLSLAAIFLVRFSFYAIEMSVGLWLG